MSLPFLNTAPGYDEELRNSVFFERGLHATSICAAVGAAVAVAMLQGQDEAGIASAAGIAASMGAGLLEANPSGGTVKRVRCGWAAHCGVAAADLARHGLTGPPTVLVAAVPDHAESAGRERLLVDLPLQSDRAPVGTGGMDAGRDQSSAAEAAARRTTRRCRPGSGTTCV